MVIELTKSNNERLYKNFTLKELERELDIYRHKLSEVLSEIILLNRLIYQAKEKNDK